MPKRSLKRSRCSRLGEQFQVLETRTLLSAAPDLAISFAKIRTPDILVPGDKISVVVRITNVGDLTARGTLASSIYASLDTFYDGSDILLGTASGKPIRLNLAPGRSVTISGTLPIQSSVQPGTYYLVATESSNLTVEDPNAANDQAASDETRDVVWQFGNVGNRKNVKMKVEYQGQTPVTFSLTGAGTGEILNPTDPISYLNVGVTNTTASSNLNIRTPAKTTTAINSIAIDGSIKRISASTTSIESGISVTGLARTIVVNNVQSVAHYLQLNTDALPVPVSAKVDITVNEVDDLAVDTGGIPVGTFKAYRVTDLSITAPTVKKITLTDKKYVSLSGELTLDQGGAIVPAKAKVDITAGRIDDCTLVTNDLRIGKLTAYRATDLYLTAPSIESMSVKNKKPDDEAVSGRVTLESVYGSRGWSLGRLAVTRDLEDFVLQLEGGANTISGRFWNDGSLMTNGTISSLSIGGSMEASVDGYVKRATIKGDYSGHWTGGFGWLTIKGDMYDALFDIGSVVGGATVNQFNSLTVGGWMTHSTLRAANPVGSITVGAMEESSIRIGATTDLPASQDDFEAHHTGLIKSLTVKGIKSSGHYVESFIDSNIAAWEIATLKLAFIDTNNSGDPFGVATTFIKTFTNRPLTGPTQKLTNLTPADSFTDGDFVLRIL